MGTRINALFNHQIVDYLNTTEVLQRLNRTMPQALVVHRYWDFFGSGAVAHKPLAWTIGPPIFSLQTFTGPGALYVSVGEHTARIHTGGRWRGFLSYPILRAVHLNAFRAIAAALNATKLIYYPDNDDVLDLFWAGEPLEACIKVLEDTVGPPQPSINDISPEIVAETEHTVPNVWYIDDTLTKEPDSYQVDSIPLVTSQ